MRKSNLVHGQIDGHSGAGTPILGLLRGQSGCSRWSTFGITRQELLILQHTKVPSSNAPEAEHAVAADFGVIYILAVMLTCTCAVKPLSAEPGWGTFGGLKG